MKKLLMLLFTFLSFSCGVLLQAMDQNKDKKNLTDQTAKEEQLIKKLLQDQTFQGKKEIKPIKFYLDSCKKLAVL